MKKEDKNNKNQLSTDSSLSKEKAKETAHKELIQESWYRCEKFGLDHSSQPDFAALPKGIFEANWHDIALQAFYQGVIATIVQMIIYVKAVQKIGPSQMGAVMSIVPVISGISAIVLFNELITLGFVVGLVLVSVGAWLAHSRYLERSRDRRNNLSIPL